MKISRIVWALLAAGAMCAGYFQMFAYRKIWRSHYPELAARWSNNGDFAVLGVFGTENSVEDLAYAARTQDAAWKLLPFDPYIKNHRSWRNLVMDYATYQLMGWAWRLVGDPNWTWIALRIACCIGWFLILCRIAWELTKEEGISLFAASFITCFSYILTFLFVHEWTHSGWAIGSKVWSLLSYGRTESICRLPRPGLTYGMLFLGQFALAKASESRKARWMFLSALFGGMLIYVRGDIGMTYIGAAFIFSAAYWLRHRSLAPAAWAAVTLLLSVPWFFANFPINPDFARFFTRSHSPDWLSVAYLAAAAAIFRYRRDPVAWSIGGVLGGAFLILNSQVVTGKHIMPFSWRYPANIELFLAALCLVPRALKARESFWRGAAAAVLALAFLQSASFAAIHFPFYGLPGDYNQALAWITRNARPDSVVMAVDPEVNLLIPVYTRSKVLLSRPMLTISDYPIAENAKQLKAILGFFEIDRRRFIEDLRGAEAADRRLIDQADRGRVLGGLLIDSYFCSFGGKSERESYLGLLDGAPAADRAIDADYVWVGPYERRYAGPDFARSHALREVYRNGSVVIFAKPR